MSSLFNKLVCGLLVTLLVVPTAFFVAPKQAEAVPTMDPGTIALVIKEYILDIIGWVISELLLTLVTSEIAEWANTNFGGIVGTVQPDGTVTYEFRPGDASFLANPQQFFTQMALGVGMNALEGTSPVFQDIFPDWDSSMLISLRDDLTKLEQSFAERYEPTMNLADLESLFADFGEGGGWGAWMEMVTKPQNNIHGALRIAREEMSRQIGAASNQTSEELQQGGGFLTMRNCLTDPSLGPPDVFGCTHYENATPGSSIRERVDQALGINTEKRAQADEITEVVAMLISSALQYLIETGLQSVGRDLPIDPISGSPQQPGNNECLEGESIYACAQRLQDELVEAGEEAQEESEVDEEERQRIIDELNPPEPEDLDYRVTGVTAVALDSYTVSVSWEPISEHSYRIYRDRYWIADVPMGATDFTDTGARHSTTYVYTVTAVIERQETNMSAPATVTTPIDPAVSSDFPLVASINYYRSSLINCPIVVAVKPFLLSCRTT